MIVATFLMGAIHYGPSYDSRPRYALDAFAERLAKEHQMQFLNSGLGSLADAKEGIWAINLVSREAMTLEQGRELAQAIAHQLLAKVFEDPLFARYCAKDYIIKNKKLRKEMVAFRLAFWDENTCRPHFPFLAQIRFADGNLYYHYADPATEALLDPIVEPWAPES